MKKPEKWTDTYPQGTKAGEEEYKFFKSLARNPKYEWRSTSGIAKEADLSKERVEEIIKKYLKKGMVFQNAKNEDLWAYWERVKDLLPKDDKSISKKDQDKRIDKITDIIIDQNQPYPGCKYGYNADGTLDADHERWSSPSVDERWHAPEEDFCYWMPIRDSVPEDAPIIEVMPPWNTNNYDGFDIDAEKTTYPHIFGFKTPEKDKICTFRD